MKRPTALLLVPLGVLVFFLLNSRLGDIPPLGKFLNPFAGFWQNNKSTDDLPGPLMLKGVRDSIRIVWDDRHVPHIFARNTYDLFFAQGYCVARDRLWQMDFVSRVAAGRLSEVMGKRTLELDRFRRRIGLTLAAENMIRAASADRELYEVLEAYRDGVNAWIATLDERSLPVEFKIFDYRPEEWSILKSALVLSNFSADLSFRSNDYEMTRVRAFLGDSLTAQLYPDVLPFADPVIPAGTPWDFPRIKAKDPEGSSLTFRPDSGRTPDFSYTAAARDLYNTETMNGSNNWALAGSHTANGHPLLCNDPHLSLTLPSIWYEVQMVSPGMNVYGVSSPGGPGVLIGFNNRIAFGETNAGSDVIDWYKVSFRDARAREYYYDGQWRPTSSRIEFITVRGEGTIADTVISTHHGPVVYRTGEKPFDSQVPAGYAMRWTALDSSLSFRTFIELDRAERYDDYVRALAVFNCPGQNFAYADVDGNIAIWHNGRFPLRRKDQGKYLCDGTGPQDEWLGWIPHDQLPHVLNPPRGFVSSANQPPADSTYPYYLGWNYAAFERSSRINQLLREASNATPSTMMALQNDILNPRAEMGLPILLEQLDTASLSPEETQCYNELKSWGFTMSAALLAPQIFEYWWQAFHEAIWTDDFQSGGGSLLLPRSDITLRILLLDQQNRFVDDKGTPQRETLRDIARLSFARAVQRLRTAFGPIGPAWSWGASRGTSISHLARIPGLGRMHLSTDGSYNTVNATQSTHGPSWRMVVELSAQPRGWGVVPGGESGNPGSLYYDNSVDTWLAGRYHELIFLQRPDTTNEHLVGNTIIRGSHL